MSEKQIEWGPIITVDALPKGDKMYVRRFRRERIAGCSTGPFGPSGEAWTDVYEVVDNQMVRVDRIEGTFTPNRMEMKEWND